MIKQKIYLIIPIIIFVILSTLFYMLIDYFELMNDLGVILGFLLAFSIYSFVLFLDLFLTIKSKNKSKNF